MTWTLRTSDFHRDVLSCGTRKVAWSSSGCSSAVAAAGPLARTGLLEIWTDTSASSFVAAYRFLEAWAWGPRSVMLFVLTPWSRPLTNRDVTVTAVLMCEGTSWITICDVGIPSRLAVLCKHNMARYFGFQRNYNKASAIRANWDRTLCKSAN